MLREDTDASIEQNNPKQVASHHAIVSLTEVLEAIDCYQQRVQHCDDVELKAVLIRSIREKMGHAAMLVDWLNRRGTESAAAWAIQPCTNDT